MSQSRGKRGEIIHNRTAFEESCTIPSQLIVIFVQGLRFDLVNRGDEGAGRLGHLAGSSRHRQCAQRGHSPNASAASFVRQECDRDRMNSPTCGYLVSLAQKRERRRVRLGELAALGELVPFRGLESVRFNGFGLGESHHLISLMTAATIAMTTTRSQKPKIEDRTSHHGQSMKPVILHAMKTMVNRPKNLTPPPLLLLSSLIRRLLSAIKKPPCWTAWNCLVIFGF